MEINEAEQIKSSQVYLCNAALQKITHVCYDNKLVLVRELNITMIRGFVLLRF